MKKLKKISAALIATALTAGCAGMLPVNAISVNDVPGFLVKFKVTANRLLLTGVTVTS